MDLGSIGDILRSYDWKCIECKTCELCSEKGDDVRLFCLNLSLIYIDYVSIRSVFFSATTAIEV